MASFVTGISNNAISLGDSRDRRECNYDVIANKVNRLSIIHNNLVKFLYCVPQVRRNYATSETKCAESETKCAERASKVRCLSEASNNVYPIL